ncbi:MAG: hypothetical protein Q8L27_03155 [archaeon]|nr:hypothetical protein [archaeon]
MMKNGYETFGMGVNDKSYESCPNCRNKGYGFVNGNYSSLKSNHIGDYDGKSAQSYRGASS